MTRTPAPVRLPNPRSALRFALASALLIAAPRLQAASHTWSGATSGIWNLASNWSAGGAPVNGETNVVLVFPNGAGSMGTMANTLTGLNVTSITFSDTAYILSGNAINLNGSIAVNGGTAFAAAQVDVDVALTGTATFTSNGSGHNNLALNGVVSGAQNVVIQSSGGPSPGVVYLSGANSYTGTTTVSSGRLFVNSISSLGAGGAGVTVAPGAGITLTGLGFNKPLAVGGTGLGQGALESQAASSSVNGAVTLIDDTLVVAASIAPLALNGNITGLFGLTLNAFGPISLTGLNTYFGVTTLAVGTVSVNGAQPASTVRLTGVASPGATLRGTGTVGGIAFGPSSGFPRTVAPGLVGVFTGTLTCGGLDLRDLATASPGALAVRLNGVFAGSFYDQLVVNGSVNVTGGTLSVSVGFVPTVGDSFVIVANDAADPVVGTFTGLPEAATFTAGGRTFQISYVGGTGNDIVLTVTSLTPVELQSFDLD